MAIDESLIQWDQAPDQGIESQIQWEAPEGQQPIAKPQLPEGDIALQQGQPIPPGYETYHDPMLGAVARPIRQDPSIGERIVGAGEAALQTGTGMTSGAVGYIGGVIKGALDAISSGQYGTQQGAEMIQKAAEDIAAKFTYAPRTETGQEYGQAVAETIAPLEALTPAAAEIGAATRAARMRVPESVPMEPTVKAIKPKTAEEIGTIARKAGEGSKKAQMQLAEEAKVDIEAMKAADRLGIDMPADVWSESELVKQTAGLTRSKVGTESAAWRESVINAGVKADEAMQTLEGGESLATVSERVKDTLSKTRGDLKSQAQTLYKDVETAMPKSEPIQAVNTLDTLRNIADELGGTEAMTSQEKALMKMIESNEVTYGRLMREKSSIGKALQGKESPYGSADEASLKRLYSALASDQLDNVEAVAGPEVREKLHFANRLTAKQKALEDRIVKSFGKDGEGSVATLMTRAIEQGSKGDITALNKLLKVVPEDMQKETIATALSDMATSKRASEPVAFDFAKFAKTYAGLRKNSPVYSKVIGAIGKDKDQVLSDLYQVSKRVTDARAKVLQTGKANQAILDSLQSENLATKIAKIAVNIGAKTLSFGTMTLDVFFKAPEDRVAQAGEVFRSQKFKDLAVEAATKYPDRKTVLGFVNSPEFRRFAKKSGITNPEAWVYGAMATEKVNEE